MKVIPGRALNYWPLSFNNGEEDQILNKISKMMSKPRACFVVFLAYSILVYPRFFDHTCCDPSIDKPSKILMTLPPWSWSLQVFQCLISPTKWFIFHPSLSQCHPYPYFWTFYMGSRQWSLSFPHLRHINMGVTNNPDWFQLCEFYVTVNVVHWARAVWVVFSGI